MKQRYQNILNREKAIYPKQRRNQSTNIIMKNSIQTQLCSYCTICGKIGDRLKDSIVKDYRRIVDTPIGRYYSTIPSEELYERYNDKLPVFFVEDIWKDEYVNLEQDGK